MRIISIAIGGLALATASLSFAQDAAAPAAAPTATAAPALTAGTTVYDPAGAVAGTIEEVTPAGAVVSTGTNRVTIPLASFGQGSSGPVLSATKADIDAAAAQAGAKAPANSPG